MKKRRRLLGKKWMLGLLTLCFVLAMTGCGATKSDSAADSFMSGSAMPESSMDDAGMLDYAGADADILTEQGKDANVTVATERKLIRTVNMTVETQDFDNLVGAVQSQVKQLGGYIESMASYNGSAYNNYKSRRNAEMTIRIPKEELDGFLYTVSSIGNVVRSNEDVKDITLAYVDLESHRNALRTEQDRLLELLEKAETVEDIITIEQRLSEVRYQLETMESQLRTYDNQVDYSTVYLYIEEVEIYTPVEEESFGQRISGGFKESLRSVGEGFVDFCVWILVNSPYLVVWAVIIAVFVLVLVWLLKHVNKPAENTPRKKRKAAKEKKEAVEEK